MEEMLIGSQCCSETLIRKLRRICLFFSARTTFPLLLITFLVTTCVADSAVVPHGILRDVIYFIYAFPNVMIKVKSLLMDQLIEMFLWNK